MALWSLTRRSRPRLHVHLAVTAPGVSVVRAAQWLMVLVSVVSLGLASWWWWESRALERVAEQYELAVERATMFGQQLADQMKRDGLTLSAQQIATVKREVAFANQLAEKRSFSWARLLLDLEDAVPPRVSINSVRLNFSESTVALHGVSLTLQDLNTLVTRLQTHPAFRRAALQDHRMQQTPERTTPRTTVRSQAEGMSGEAGAAVVFNLTAVYRPTVEEDGT